MTTESAVAPAPTDKTENEGRHRKWRRVHGLQVTLWFSPIEGYILGNLHLQCSPIEGYILGN